MTRAARTREARNRAALRRPSGNPRPSWKPRRSESREKKVFLLTTFFRLRRLRSLIRKVDRPRFTGHEIARAKSTGAFRLTADRGERRRCVRPPRSALDLRNEEQRNLVAQLAEQRVGGGAEDLIKKSMFPESAERHDARAHP